MNSDIQITRPEDKATVLPIRPGSDAKLVSVLILMICLLPCLFAMHSALPYGLRAGLFDLMGKNPRFGHAVSTAFIIVLNSGGYLCLAAFALNVGMIFIKECPVWLKFVTSCFVLTACLGVYAVRSAIITYHG